MTLSTSKNLSTGKNRGKSRGGKKAARLRWAKPGERERQSEFMRAIWRQVRRRRPLEVKVKRVVA